MLLAAVANLGCIGLRELEDRLALARRTELPSGYAEAVISAVNPPNAKPSVVSEGLWLTIGGTPLHRVFGLSKLIVKSRRADSNR